jgi:hypothetical protein
LLSERRIVCRKVELGRRPGQGAEEK